MLGEKHGILLSSAFLFHFNGNQYFLAYFCSDELLQLIKIFYGFMFMHKWINGRYDILVKSHILVHDLSDAISKVECKEMMLFYSMKNYIDDC